MKKLKDSPKTTKRNPKDELGDNSKKFPEIPEYEVCEAQIDRVRDISPKNDKSK
jgi:hypothetical protein